MQLTARKSSLGQRGWQVEWTTDVPIDECGDAIIDGGTEHRRTFSDESEAWAFAKSVYPHDFFGAVSVTLVELSDPYDENIRQTFYWEAVGDSEYYSGEE